MKKDKEQSCRKVKALIAKEFHARLKTTPVKTIKELNEWAKAHCRGAQDERRGAVAGQ